MGEISARYRRAVRRLQNARYARATAKVTFLVNLAKRHGMTVHSEAVGQYPCQDGHRQHVGEIQKLGGVWFYKSMACTGCEAGARHLGNGAIVPPLPEKCLGCHIVQNNWLVSFEPVEVGQVAQAKDPYSQLLMKRSKP